MVIRTLVLMCVLAVAAPIAAEADNRSDAQAQVDFGIAVAQRGLWREAIYRWERASEIDPSYAPAWNNLSIAYENQGAFDKARDACARPRTGQSQYSAKLRPFQGNQ